ncbi:MAG: hypothetical protein NVSMB48_15810 [Marmoricola sp.]
MKKSPKPTRATVLRAVIDEILTSQNGQIPTDIEGLYDFFDGVDDLTYALLLRWHTRLVASLERGLADEPEDREDAVIEAWRHATWIYWGVRLIIDNLTANPPTDGVAHAIAITARNDWASMAIAAGLASSFDEPAVRIGHRLEMQARERNVEQQSVGRNPASATFFNRLFRPRQLR